MNKVKLGDIGKIVTGKTPSTKNSLFFGNDYMFITPEDISNNPSNINQSKRYVSELGLNSIKTNSITGESIVVGCIGDIGTIGFVKEKCATNQQINSITNIKPDFCPKFIFYYLQLQKNYLKNQAGQTVLPILPKSVFEEIEICVPNFSTQYAIARVLSSLDDKIELNRKINKELESLARTLYNYWFMQFNFPDKNRKPYKASGGKMLFNEQLKREIPEGWKVISVNEMASSFRGVTYCKDDLLSTKDDGVLVLRGNNIQNNTLVYDNNTAYIPESLLSKEQYIKKYDIIMTMSSGSKEHIGKCAMFQNDSPHTFGAFLTKFTPQSDKRYFIFHSFLSSYFKEKIKAICSGTGINNLTNQTFDEVLFPIPDSTTLEKFETQVERYYSLIGNNLLQNEDLNKLRDYLLPLLMNGQVTVKEAENKVEKIIPFKKSQDNEQRFQAWKQKQKIAARTSNGKIKEETLRKIFNIMEKDDK